MRRGHRAMPPGEWLVLDREDAPPHDFSVWRYDRDLNLVDQLLVSWAGVLRPENSAEDHTRNWSVEHREGWSDRYLWMQLNDAQLVQLTMAAAHGVFRRSATRLWERIMT